MCSICYAFMLYGLMIFHVFRIRRAYPLKMWHDKKKKQPNQDVASGFSLWGIILIFSACLFDGCVCVDVCVNDTTSSHEIVSLRLVCIIRVRFK